MENNTLSTDNSISTKLDVIPCFNLSLQQNNVPIVKAITLVNDTDNMLDNLVLHITAAPECVPPTALNVQPLHPRASLTISTPNVDLDYAFLAKLTEAVQGKLTVKLLKNDQPLAETSQPFTAFAPDQWLGLDIMPELLASFVTPNIPCIAALQTAVAEELRNATGDASIQEYQAGRERAYAICAAAYRALHAWNIRYAPPPASFSNAGQRIRLPDAVHALKMATCLDSSVLYASLLEQCGLNPVILFEKGHAYVGCHLKDDYFPDSPMDDLQVIRKRVENDDFTVVETTALANNLTFAEAEADAKLKRLNQDDTFMLAIDIKRARLSKVLPLPLRYTGGGLDVDPVPPKRECLQDEQNRSLQRDVDLNSLQAAEVGGRVERWAQKLLDLSLRNKLINAKDTRTIPIVCHDITELEDLLAAGKTFTLGPLENLLTEKDVNDISQLRTSVVQSEAGMLLKQEMEKQRLWSTFPKNTLLKLSKDIYRAGKTDVEESGVNTTFLALGMLEWKQNERDDKTYLAPILLIPVKLTVAPRTGIKLEHLDEETIVNETLLELLRTQFHITIPGINPIPMDQSGVDVAKILQIFRQSIKDLPGWEVREYARIGQFSFGKYIMWHDLTARIDDLKKSPMVNHLIQGGGYFDDGIQVFPQENVAKHINYDELFCPLSADASQLAAVLYSQMGKNFVLHGPPGTGKSQTITNIIAHNLAHGKKVLFVSEKKVALDVVHRRLSQIGLKPFCLELHSNKGGKAEVMKQFAEALAVPEVNQPEEWDETVKKLQLTRQELDDYVQTLHKSFPNGLSTYDCFSQLATLDADPDDLIDKTVNTLTQSKDDLELLKQTANQLEQDWNVTNHAAYTAIKAIRPAEWSPALQRDIIAAAQALAKQLATLKQKLTALDEAIDLNMSDVFLDCAAALKCLAYAASTCNGDTTIPSEMLATEKTISESPIVQFLELNTQLKELHSVLEGFQINHLETLDCDQLTRSIQQNRQAFFIIKYFKNRALVKEYAHLKQLDASPLTLNELTSIIPAVRQLQELNEQAKQLAQQVQPVLGALWNNGKPDTDAVNHALQHAQQLNKLIATAVGKHKTDEPILRNAVRKLLESHANTGIKDTIGHFATAFEHAERSIADFDAFAEVSGLNNLSKLEAIADAMEQSQQSIRSVLRFKTTGVNATNIGLAKLLDNIVKQHEPVSNVAHDVFNAYCKLMLDQILQETPQLASFSGLNHQETIQRFIKLDNEYADLTKQTIFAKLAQQLPRRRSGPCPEGTELGLLKRECEKKTRHKPVRQLLEQIPSLAYLLKPCFLMSPLSIAQFLPADSAPFDLIVFDEASQIPVWDAVGVIARAKQLIVVGDPKQMPPTNFFQKGDDQEDETAMETQDLESILDECLATGVHSTFLNWHYRSRHEALIAFSNHHYYEDRLFTFPAASNAPELGVKFHFVPDAVYDKRKTRTNLTEAKQLVQYVFDRIEHAETPRSFGIVTFSQAQKDLIEDLIDAKRAECPQFEHAFSDQLEEPFFVKNLENVQGDERDVILFSICYAPDSDGRFSMNFGPLNRQGGERRLNVAITRAKQQVVVFSSVHAHQIDLNRTAAKGAEHLKAFLDYAEKGTEIPAAHTADQNKNKAILEIQQFLQDNGYATLRNVGNSACKISLAVKHPEHADRYLAAIETDGYDYAAQDITRDRVQLRSSVLKALGWNMFRIWCMDWLLDRERTQKQLLDFLKHALEKSAESPAASPQLPQGSQPETDGKPDDSGHFQQRTENTGTPCETASNNLPPPSPNCIPYVTWTPDRERTGDDFYAPAHTQRIANHIREIIKTESPICEHILRKRILRAWGLNRATDAANARIDNVMPKDLIDTTIDGQRVFWNSNADLETYTTYRSPNDQDEKRAIDDIPPYELANSMLDVMNDLGACEIDVLYREAVKPFGLSVVTAKARRFLDIALQWLKDSGKCQ